MQEQSERPPRLARVIPATRDQEPILANLLELYIHDFSEILPMELGPDGRFGYKDLSNYWIEPDRHPFLITVDEQLAGFALVKKGSALSPDDENTLDSVWDMAEFFIVRAHRRHGIGLTAAHQVWRQFSGPWQVRVMDTNRPALQFWQRAVDAFVGGTVASTSIERDDKTWAVFGFSG